MRDGGKKPSLHGLGHRELGLDNHLVALALCQRNARRAQMQPEVDGDAERTREDNVANPVQLQLAGLQNTDQHRLGQPGDGIERDCQKAGEREGARGDRRRGRATSRTLETPRHLRKLAHLHIPNPF